MPGRQACDCIVACQHDEVDRKMSTSLPPPAGTGGNGKYIALGGLFVAGIVALLLWKSCDKPQPVVTVPSVAPPPSNTFNAKVDDVPPPPPIEPDAGPEVKPANTRPGDPCVVKSCSGATTPELESALAFRAKQAHRCYDSALANDATLQGKIQISVRVASNGNVCSAGVVSSETGMGNVANCVANTFRMSGHFPSPKSGCVDAAIPIAFVPGGR
jgi:hypothetical protein